MALMMGRGVAFWWLYPPPVTVRDHATYPRTFPIKNENDLITSFPGYSLFSLYISYLKQV